MLILPSLAAILASTGWAAGIILAQAPARALGAFEFTRIQLIACSALMAIACSALGLWTSISWTHWPAFLASTVVGIILGNLAMIECLRRGGPRRTELLLALKAPLVAVMAYFWLDERLAFNDGLGAAILLTGLVLAIRAKANSPSETDKLNGSLLEVLCLGIAATACQGFGFLVLKPAMVAGTDPLAASAIRLLGAAFAISVVALWPSEFFRPKSPPTPKLIGRTIIPGFIGYGVSSSLLLYAFANMDAGIAAVLGSLSPILVLPMLWLKDGLLPGPAASAGAILAVIGSAIILLT